jgi:cell division protein FtsI/penicillin-binding protein 2
MISKRRLTVLAIVILTPVVIVLARSAQIQIIQWAPLSARARSQQMLTWTGQPLRGAIYDSNGNVLAVSNRAYVIRVNPATLTDTFKAASLIAPVVARPVEEASMRIQAIISDSKAITPTLPNIVYADVSPQAVVQLTSTLGANGLAGVSVEPTWVRSYPQGPLAGPTMGFVSLQPQGYSGVEGYYNSELSGKTGMRKELGPMELLAITLTQSGADLVLTLNMPLQIYAEQRLARAITEYKAAGGTVIVMDTRSGAILASASTPGYDPNRALDIANSDNAKRLHDPAVSDTYEPGSVIKLITVASAVEAGTITTRSVYYDGGKYVVGGKTIRNSDLAAHGKVDIQGMLEESLNVVAAQISADMGPEAFYYQFGLFGFGRLSAIDLGNEAPGMMRTPADSDWSIVDLATNSFGQGMSATPYQVLNAVNAIANDGVLMQPYVVQQWRTQDGQVINKRPTPIQRAVSPETARQVRALAAEATRRASPKALVKGYTVAGKTGTADWYLRGIKQNTTIVTYVGFLPAYEPRITILVKLDQPTPKWAAYTALPVFHDMAERAVQILGIPPDIVQEEK